MSVEPILQILSLLFVVAWTARLARNKGRNALLWAGAAAIPALGLVDIFPDWLTVFCMLPMLALVFMRARQPLATDGEQDNTVPCPRCQHTHEPGPSFCTNCGWELTRPYATADATGDSADAAEATVALSAETTADAEAPPTPEPVLASQQTVEADPTPSTQPAQPEAEPAPAFAVAPLKITRSLTAAGMTELGLSLFNQGRVREAVDQFTKAIALDPRYREAWANRAKAYSELGLSEKAAADRQQLEAI
jgi:tetratricopeptide (TPR) repeat protein